MCHRVKRAKVAGEPGQKSMTSRANATRQFNQQRLWKKKSAYDTRIHLPRKFPRTGVFDDMACEQERWNQAQPRSLVAEARKICPNDVCSTYRKLPTWNPRPTSALLDPMKRRKTRETPAQTNTTQNIYIIYYTFVPPCGQTARTHPNRPCYAPKRYPSSRLAGTSNVRPTHGPPTSPPPAILDAIRHFQ